MNIRNNYSIFTLFAIVMCLLLPTFAKLVDNKLYIVRRLKSNTETNLLIGVEIARNEEGEEVSAGIFGILPELWEPLFKRYIPTNVTSVEVPLEEVPVVGLITIVQYRSELYSPALPSLLARTTPKKIVETLPVNRLSELTPEARAQIAPEQLEELEKLYENAKIASSRNETRTS